MRTLPIVCIVWVSLCCRGTAAHGQELKLIARPDAFPPLVNPQCSHCVDEAKRRASELQPDDPVLAWTRGYFDGGAIPIRFFLNSHRVISDSYGVFVYDPDAGYARAFAPSYHFVFHGWRNGVMVMKDTSDGTLYSCLSGVAFAGPRKGESLASVPTIVTTWGDVMRRNPDAVTYHMFEKYRPSELPRSDEADSVTTRGQLDPRLPGDAIVLGVRAGGRAKAYPLAKLVVVTHDTLGGEKIVILKHGNSAAAYRPIARQPRKYVGPKPDKHGVSPPNPGTPLPDGKELPPIAVSDFSAYDIAGRCLTGERKGWTLEPVEGLQCKWFAWSAEFPTTEVQADADSSGAKPSTAKSDGKETAEKKSVAVKPSAKKPAAKKPSVKMISGTSEFLRVLPKPFGIIKAIDAKVQTVTLLLDGEKVAKVWAIEPDAELKVDGWWGRLEQFRPEQRVWVWLKLNRARQPVGVAMLADEVSEWDMHASLADKPADAKSPAKFTEAVVQAKRSTQQQWLRQQWTADGLPGTLTFHHVFSGELEVMLDHEAMRWGRSLRAGDAVTLVNPPGGAMPEIKAVVRTVTPWRERTQVRLVVGELASADLKLGQRLHLKMTPLSKEAEDSPYPPDIDRPRGREERAEWFLCNIYCVCPVGKDTCTGMFYTLASCNPNGCGAPQATREEILQRIDKQQTDREIWDELLEDRGPLMLRPHLRP